MNRRGTIRALALAPVVAALILSGCTSDTAPTDEPTAEATVGAESGSPREAEDTGAVIAEAQTDLGDKGIVTAVLRSVTADDEVMHLRYALTREGGDPDAETFYELGIGNAPTVADLANLRAYRPFCGNGSWTGDSRDRQACGYSVLGTVPNHQIGALPADTTLEIGVLLPAPQGAPENLEVILGDGLPSFSQVPVTYVTDAR